MTAQQLGKLIKRIIYNYEDDNISDRELDHLLKTLPHHIIDLSYEIDKGEVYKIEAPVALSFNQENHLRIAREK